MKALILAGGRGKRLGHNSRERNKCMLELMGKPLIEYSLDNSVRISPEEIIIVVGYLAEQVINHFGNNYHGVRIRYAIQHEQKGLVHAIETAAPFIDGSDFMLFLGDEILLQPNHMGMLRQYEAGDAFSLCGVTVPEDREAARNTYAVLEDQQGRILRLVEKPNRSLNRYQGTGNIVFNGEILNYIPGTPTNTIRKEKELPDLIQRAIDEGHVVRSFLIGGHYININTPDDIAKAEQTLASREVQEASASIRSRL